VKMVNNWSKCRNLEIAAVGGGGRGLAGCVLSTERELRNSYVASYPYIEMIHFYLGDNAIHGIVYSFLIFYRYGLDIFINAMHS
jgi:hypothetical protein